MLGDGGTFTANVKVLATMLFYVFSRVLPWCSHCIPMTTNECISQHNYKIIKYGNDVALIHLLTKDETSYRAEMTAP